MLAVMKWSRCERFSQWSLSDLFFSKELLVSRWNTFWECGHDHLFIWFLSSKDYNHLTSREPIEISLEILLIEIWCHFLQSPSLKAPLQLKMKHQSPNKVPRPRAITYKMLTSCFVSPLGTDYEDRGRNCKNQDLKFNWIKFMIKVWSQGKL